MKLRAVLFVLGCAVAGCDAPPRDVAYFAAHADEARHVLSNCAAGDRSRECENARAALGQLKAQARKERYRKGFE